MAVLYITEYKGLGYAGPHSNQLTQTMDSQSAIAEQNIAIAAGSASVQLSATTRVVRLNTDAACSIAFGVTAPAAVATAHRMSANSTEIYLVQPGSFIAVITNS